MILPPSHKVSHLSLMLTMNQVGLQSVERSLTNALPVFDVYQPVELTAGQTAIYPLNTFHSLSYRIIGGTGTIKIDNLTVSLQDGDSSFFTYLGLNTQIFEIVCTTGNISIILNKI